MRKTIYGFVLRLTIIPFDSAFAFFCMYSGISAILNFGIVPNLSRQVLGGILPTIFDIGFAIAGLTMFFGIGLGRRDTESFGLIILATSLLIRTIIIGYLMGISPMTFNSYVYNTIFILTCLVKLHSLAKNKALLQVNPRITVKEQLQNGSNISIY